MITSTDDPFETAKTIYQREPCARSFEEDLCLHLMTPGCIVYKDKANLALARPVERSYEYATITDPRIVSQTPDCWWIYLLVGNFNNLIGLIPYPLTWIGWERNNKPRFFKFKQLEKHVARNLF